VNHSDKRETKSAEIKFQTSEAGFTLLDVLRNKEIWSHINIYNLNAEIKNQKRNCYFKNGQK
jgi:hypothetical protein